MTSTWICNFPKRDLQPARRDSSFPITVSRTKLPRLGTMVGTRLVGRHLTPIIHLFVALARLLDPYGSVRSRINF